MMRARRSVLGATALPLVVAPLSVVAQERPKPRNCFGIFGIGGQ
tara:strand:- start:841 stop:972 length:132 start_codon:yes stop_codon:yes gene_type:complete